MKIALFLKGAAMGIAEAIPGVSGGTIAFITGIYQELIETIKSFTPSNLRLVLHDRQAFWKAINGLFLARLITGMAIGLIFGILVISHLLEHYQSLLWSFFYGLVLASAVFLAKDVEWNGKSLLATLIGAILAYLITSLSPATGSEHVLYLFFAGCLAISAMMLPGISGSFVLLLLGLYQLIINGLKAIIADQDFSKLGSLIIFGLGVLVGLFSFARVLSYLFKRFPNGTVATMIGILIGSLSKLWPWKIINQAYFKTENRYVTIEDIRLPDPELYKVVSETLVLPNTFAEYGDPQTLFVLLSMIIGILAVAILAKLSSKTAD